MDGMAMIGHRSSKSTFGANDIEEKNRSPSRSESAKGEDNPYTSIPCRYLNQCTLGVFIVVQVCVKDQLDPLLIPNVGNSPRKHQYA